MDLGEENVTELKMPSELEAERQASDSQEPVESAAVTTTQMAERSGERLTKVNIKLMPILIL